MNKRDYNLFLFIINSHIFDTNLTFLLNYDKIYNCSKGVLDKMNKKNIRFTSAILSLALASGIALTSPINAFAENKPKQGKFIECNLEEGERYNKYVVKKGDTVSHISEKICKFFGKEITSKYWPAIAFLNDFPKTMKPGDIIIFPETFEELALLNSELRSIGWTARYIQGNDIYGKRKEKQKSSIKDLLREIYGNNVNIDEDFVYRYLNAVGLAGKYDANSGNFTPDELFALTDWIPSLEDLGVKKQEKTKSK